MVLSGPAEPERSPPRYHAVFLSTLWVTGASPAAVNNSNQITGVRNGRAFLYSHGTGEMIDLGTFGGQYGRYSDGVALNDSGQVAGRAPMDLPNFADRAFLYHDGAMVNLGAVPGSLSTSRTRFRHQDGGIIDCGRGRGSRIDKIGPGFAKCGEAGISGVGDSIPGSRKELSVPTLDPGVSQASELAGAK